MSSSAAAALSLSQQTFRRSSKRICCSAAAAEEEEEVQASGQDALRKPPSQGRLFTPPRQTQDSLKSWSGLPSSQRTSQIIVAYLLHQKCNQTGPVVIPSLSVSLQQQKAFFFFFLLGSSVLRSVHQMEASLLLGPKQVAHTRA